ncbi:MAG: hypothetical protein R3232_08685 [Clostridia bacterium]|nr:hypothetical protein [Clostridia bacterium]
MTRIRISLLPSELKRQSSLMRLWTIVAMVLAIIAIALLIANLLLAGFINSSVSELEQLKAENDRYTENIGRLSYIKEMFDEIEANNAEITGLRGVDPDWGFVVDSVAADAGLYGIKVDRMVITTKSDEPACTLYCWTSDIDNIDVWKEHINGLGDVNVVEITDVTTNVLSENRLEFKFTTVLGISRWKAE